MTVIELKLNVERRQRKLMLSNSPMTKVNKMSRYNRQDLSLQRNIFNNKSRMEEILLTAQGRFRT